MMTLGLSEDYKKYGEERLMSVDSRVNFLAGEVNELSMIAILMEEGEPLNEV